MNIDLKLFKVAYKKLKSSLYFDKTVAILRDNLVSLEMEYENIDFYLEELFKDFFDTTKRKTLYETIISSINYHAFPKTLKDGKKDMITNYSTPRIKIEDNQYFIDMDIRGHILGVLWLLLIGYRVDKNMYEHSYGNRIRRNMYNEISEAPTYSPYLFEPYFQQYEGWRDNAMNAALNHLHDGQDVVILTLDFKRFYYSVDITEALFDRMYEDEIENDSEELRSLHYFIFSIIEAYSKCLKEFSGRNILPIGFLPSNIIANYALRNFDKAILDGWNPIYYGRYVDDVIVVDKIETNSDLYNKAKDDTLSAKDIIGNFLEQCSSWKGINGIKCENEKGYALFSSEDISEKPQNDYVLNKLYNPEKNDNSHIVIKNEKVKIFYFKSGESDALITCFKEIIAKNKSEFRHMPEDEAIFQNDDYNQIYDLKNDETINKFRGIDGISIDKFELSKLLGKHLRIGGLINDIRETGFEKQIFKIMNPRVIVENYSVWEKIVEILVINEFWDGLKQFIQMVKEAIDLLDYKDDTLINVVRKTLRKYLLAALGRSLALSWGKEVNEIVEFIYTQYKDNKIQLLEKYEFDRKRKGYCVTRMVDKSVMPIFIDMLDMDKIYQSKSIVSLCDFRQMLECCKNQWSSDYVYYPYLVTMYDFSIISCIEQLKEADKFSGNLKQVYDSQIKKYLFNNYKLYEDTYNITQKIQVNGFEDRNAFLIQVNNGNKDKLRLAIANVSLNHDNFKNIVIDNPNRSYKRYSDLSKLINAAIDERADMLIMPEAFVPFEWLATVARTCARNNLAIVTGIEHIKKDTNIYNLTAVILPYEDMKSKNALISFHLKTHYAPAEKQEINGYRFNEIKGKHYELYQWYGCYFPVYCCYELTSITERAMFQSYADFLVAIEWNKDINYYSNILESLSRDIHCYCVQVNSSEYGDSRITKPSKTEEKDIIRTKGGRNTTILVDEIDIRKIRDFQIKEYNLQDYDKTFKPTPPGFDPGIVLKKIKGEYIINKE